MCDLDLKKQFYCSAVLILTIKKNEKNLMFSRRVDHTPCSSLKCTNKGPTLHESQGHNEGWKKHRLKNDMHSECH